MRTCLEVRHALVKLVADLLNRVSTEHGLHSCDHCTLPRVHKAPQQPPKSLSKARAFTPYEYKAEWCNGSGGVSGHMHVGTCALQRVSSDCGLHT